MNPQSTISMDSKNEDIFSSNGGFYSSLAPSGYFDIKELSTFKNKFPFAGPPHTATSSGIRIEWLPWPGHECSHWAALS
jgi:hypothetical protein